MKHFFHILIVFCLVTIPAKSNAEFIFAHINESIMPLDRGEKYEDPLDLYLKQNGMGEVTGGGSSLTKERFIEWVGVDIELNNPERDLEMVIKKLKELGAPEGSFFERYINDKVITIYIK